MKKILIICLIFLLFVAGLVFAVQKPTTNLRDVRYLEAKIEESYILLNIFVSEAEMTNGLSGTASLPPNTGALFVFEDKGYYGIWMRNMNYPIDIAWIDEDRRIIHIENSVLPETFPKVFYPPTKNKYVLEIGAGFFEKNNINIGDKLEFIKFYQKI